MNRNISPLALAESQAEKMTITSCNQTISDAERGQLTEFENHFFMLVQQTGFQCILTLASFKQDPVSCKHSEPVAQHFHPDQQEMLNIEGS